ncbi:MAG TPA: 2-C-methyl-D-erythritol 4-phosphate cytidylyltransferase [Solirubrobacterales bacterium]|nr:2-C-methyl-D-erythritol 4-phosphate cytidylyltransferase [Solirubrobacterales bacterium]
MASPQPPRAPAATAVIAAAGSGERLGAGGPKAFVPLAGRPMIEWSVAALRACDSVRAIVVAAPPGHDHDLAGDDLTVLDGGATRAQSVANALAAVETELVAIHDAARPLLTPELVETLVASLTADSDAAAVIPAAPVADTVKQAQGGVVERTLDRSLLWAAQTPQVFRAEALRAALDVDDETRDTATDEAMLIEAAGGKVLIQPAPAENFKVTTPHDLRVAELLLSDRAASR